MLEKIACPSEFVVSRNTPHGEESAVYRGGLTSLTPATWLKWRYSGSGLYDYEYLTLTEIQNQMNASRTSVESPLITVFVQEPRKGLILQYGNYRDGDWYIIGETSGYV